MAMRTEKSLEQFADARHQEACEAQKDFGCKTRYFGLDEIERKIRQVLTTMHDSELTLAAMGMLSPVEFGRQQVFCWNKMVRSSL